MAWQSVNIPSDTHTCVVVVLLTKYENLYDTNTYMIRVRDNSTPSSS